LLNRAELFWQQSQILFDHWDRMLAEDAQRVQRECALYRRWLAGFDPADEDSLVIRDVLLEMISEMMVDAALAG
jgi:hypothetical protein